MDAAAACLPVTPLRCRRPRPWARLLPKASAHATRGEAELASLSAALTRAQLEKMTLKLKVFEDFEALLAHERNELERDRQQLYLDRLAFKKTVLAAREPQGASDAMTGVEGGGGGGSSGAAAGDGKPEHGAGYGSLGRSYVPQKSKGGSVPSGSRRIVSL